MLLSFVPLLVLAEGSFIPCDGYTNECDFNDIMHLANNTIEFALKVVAVPLAIAMVLWAGWLLITSGDNAGNRTKAKNILLNTFIGISIAFASYIIIRLILTKLGYVAPAGLEFIN